MDRTHIIWKDLVYETVVKLKHQCVGTIGDATTPVRDIIILYAGDLYNRGRIFSGGVARGGPVYGWDQTYPKGKSSLGGVSGP